MSATLSNLPPEMVQTILKHNSLIDISTFAQTAKNESRAVKEIFTTEEVVKLRESLAANKKEKAKLEKAAWDDKKWRWLVILPIAVLGALCFGSVPALFILMAVDAACPLFVLPLMCGLLVVSGIPLFAVCELGYRARQREMARNVSLEQTDKLIQEQTVEFNKILS